MTKNPYSQGAGQVVASPPIRKQNGRPSLSLFTWKILGRVSFLFVLIDLLLQSGVFFSEIQKGDNHEYHPLEESSRSNRDDRNAVHHTQLHHHRNGNVIRRSHLRQEDNEGEETKNNEQSKQPEPFWEQEEGSDLQEPWVPPKVNKEQQSEEQKHHDGQNDQEQAVTDQEDQREDINSEEDAWIARNDNVPIADWDYFPQKPQVVREPILDNDFDLSECPAFMSSIDTSPPPPRTPTHKACEGYDGVLHIQQYDWGGASGTAFFELNIGMLQWADQHNYLPWVHIYRHTKPIWDEKVHMQGSSNSTSFEMMEGMEMGWARDERDKTKHIFPGKPFQARDELYRRTFRIRGTGVWRHYFEPVSDFVHGDKSCKTKPLIRFQDNFIVPGIHSYAPWAPPCLEAHRCSLHRTL